MLLVAATPREAEAVAAGLGARLESATLWSPMPLIPYVEVLITGVGKANAAGAVARTLDADRHQGVLSVGVCGALPGGPEVGATILATRSVFADEGLELPGAFQSCRQMGFALGPGESDEFEAATTWRVGLTSLVDAQGVIATVSTCSGRDDLAQRVRERTGALAEAMEGAGVALAAARVNPMIAFAELRSVSNTTGDRRRQRWDLDGALGALSDVLGRLFVARGA